MRDTRPRPDLYEYLATAYATAPIDELVAHAASLGYVMSPSALHHLARRRGLRRVEKGRIPNAKKSTPQFDFLRQHYGTDATPEWLLAEVNKLGREIPSIKAMRRVAQILGVRRPIVAPQDRLGESRGLGFGTAKFKAALANTIPSTWPEVEAWARERAPDTIVGETRIGRLLKVNIARMRAGERMFRIMVPSLGPARIQKAMAPNGRGGVKMVKKTLPDAPSLRRESLPAPLPSVHRVAGPPEMSKILAVFEPATDAMVEARNRAVTRKGCDNPRWSGNVRPTHEYCGAAVRPGETYCAACRMGLVTARSA